MSVFAAAHGRETPGLKRILGMGFAVLSALRPYSLCVTLIDEHENTNGHQYRPILQGRSANSTNNDLEVFGPYLGIGPNVNQEIADHRNSVPTVMQGAIH